MTRNIRRVDTNWHGPDVPNLDGGDLFCAVSAILVTCISKDGKPNIIPLTGWGVLSRYPHIFAIAICKGNYTKDYFPRYTRRLLDEVPEFVVNVPHAGMRDAISICGSVSGDKADKFQLANLTPEPSIVVRPPAIAECPASFECIVRHVVSLGSHDAFMGETVAVHSGIVKTETDEDINIMSLMPGKGWEGKLLWRALPWWEKREDQ